MQTMGLKLKESSSPITIIKQLVQKATICDMHHNLHFFRFSTTETIHNFPVCLNTADHSRSQHINKHCKDSHAMQPISHQKFKTHLNVANESETVALIRCNI